MATASNTTPNSTSTFEINRREMQNEINVNARRTIFIELAVKFAGELRDVESRVKRLLGVE